MVNDRTETLRRSGNIKNCPACGCENSGVARQCARCGSWLSATHLAQQSMRSVEPPSVPESRFASATTLASFISPRIAAAPTTPSFAPPRAVLRVIIGYTNKREIDFSGGTVNIGRAPDNNLVVDDGRVSRQHARIDYESGQWRIKDANSHNGTYVNGARIHSHMLRPGDRIVVGSTLLEFHLH